MLNTPTRTVDAGGIEVRVYEPPHSSMPPGYNAVYRTEDTKVLDQRFGLNGRAATNPVIENELEKATKEEAIGDGLTARILQCLVDIAKRTVSFVGVRQNELAQNGGFTPQEIDHSLAYRDEARDNISYLTTLEVEGQQVMFPANLQKQNAS